MRNGRGSSLIVLECHHHNARIIIFINGHNEQLIIFIILFKLQIQLKHQRMDGVLKHYEADHYTHELQNERTYEISLATDLTDVTANGGL